MSTVSSLSRHDAWFKRIEKYAADRAAPQPDSCVHWLHGDECSDVYCYDCVAVIPLFGVAVSCMLRHLLGFELDEEAMEDCVEFASKLADGGWRGEEDRLEHCENCGVRLSCCLTEYGAHEELVFWEGFEPPKNADEWQMFEEMLNSVADKELPTLALLWQRWGLAYSSWITWHKAQVRDAARCPRCFGQLILGISHRTESEVIFGFDFKTLAPSRQGACPDCGMYWQSHRLPLGMVTRSHGLIVHSSQPESHSNDVPHVSDAPG